MNNELDLCSKVVEISSYMCICNIALTTLQISPNPTLINPNPINQIRVLKCTAVQWAYEKSQFDTLMWGSLTPAPTREMLDHCLASLSEQCTILHKSSKNIFCVP